MGADRIERAADVDAIHFDTALRGTEWTRSTMSSDALRGRLAAYEAGEGADHDVTAGLAWRAAHPTRWEVG